MRSPPLTWLLLSAMLLVAVLGFWHGSDRKPAAPPPALASLQLLSQVGTLDSPPVPGSLTQHATRNPTRFPHRLANTAAPLKDLIHRPTAILLENALLDTAQPLAMPIPDHLRPEAEPGAYVVQARGVTDDAFRARLQAAAAIIIAYIPNHAYLVRASGAAAQRLQADPEIRAVLPYQPYFKLKPPLLALAVAQRPLSVNQALTVLLYPDVDASARDELSRLGVQILGEESSPFGPVLTVRTGFADTRAVQSSRTPATAVVPALARLPGVQAIDLARQRVLANDLSRASIAVAADSIRPSNYLSLTGTNVLVSVVDSGVDTNHPDLQGRIICDIPISGVDSNGHGTHVAGIIAGNGSQSTTVTNAGGSIMPALPFQFRGRAPAARILAFVADSNPGPVSDSAFQEAAARTNAFVSNNSWHYANDNAYDLAAARYDAAARDALPAVPGSQPLLFVFGAGNCGHGADDGSGGEPDTIQSPATAKNVITVGALEQPRSIADQVWQCTTVNGTNNCSTNQPWLALTDTNNQVTAFSSRGNVGVGIEGDRGRLKPDVVAPGAFVVSARSTQWDQLAYYGPSNGSSNYFAVLSNLNHTLGPFYRYESGTSLSAAEVSGALALMQEFFQRFGRTNSPALMKALLINGARPLTAPGAFQVHSPTNSQGWGLINLTNSLPPALSNSFAQAAAPMHLFDQDPANALATGESRTRFVSRSPAATNQPLRLTLVWTDPPANPAAGLKLVNNLDLVVTNLLTGEVFVGNDFAAGSSFNPPWETNSSPNLDAVNNVENVFLAPAVGTNYSVTVVARAVNVNAVTARTNNVVQDYALVIAGGDGQVHDALTIAEIPIVSVTAPGVTFLADSFAPGQGFSGGLYYGQRVGAQGPSRDTNNIAWPGGANGVITLGLTNQWRFYVLTNDHDYTNAAFATCLPPDLSLPRSAVNQSHLTNATRGEADIDLYVSTDPALTNLDSAALAAADKRLGRRGTAALVYSNAAPGAVYYVGIKAEGQQAAEFALLGVFSLLPFGEQDQNGSWMLRGINLPAVIPDGAAARPGVTSIVAIAPAPIPIRRVVVTNELWHERFSDLLGTLTHGGKSAVLNRHSLPPVDPVPYQYTYLYEDNGEGDIPGAQPTDPPGSLRNFIGEQGQGVWLLSLADAVPGQTGLVANLSIRLDPQNVANSASREVSTNLFSFDFVDVPIGATNLAVCLYNDSSPSLPVELYLRRGDLPAQTNFDHLLVADPTPACLSVNLSTLPPLRPGRYYLGVFNPNDLPQTIRLDASLSLDPAGVVSETWATPEPTAILDDAVTCASLCVSNGQAIASLDVGLRVSHPRISDLVFTLISPAGTRVLLCDGRGGTTTNGLAASVLRTNVFERREGIYTADTNVLDLEANQGVLYLACQFWQDADTVRVYYDNATVPLYDSGPINLSNHIVVPFGPGASSNLVIVVNEGNNTNTQTIWEYTPAVVSPAPAWLVLTENTNLAQVPIKFAPPPFVPAGTNAELWFLPEQSLNTLVGESAYGTWRLEMWDTRAGAADPAPELASWQLRFVFANTAPVPLALTHGAARSNTVPPGQIAPFSVDVPAWAAYATNIIVQASAPVSLLFNTNLPPTGTNAGDFTLLSASTGGSAALTTNGTPSLIPGAKYYLGVQNFGTTPVTATVQVDFDVTPLANGVPFYTTVAGSPLPEYFAYDVSSNGTAVSFQLLNLDGNLELVARNTPFPTLTNYDYRSLNPGTNDENILIFADSTPAPLSPGRWYLGVFNAAATNVTGTILATEYTNAFPPIIALANGAPHSHYNSGPAEAADYFRYTVTTNARRAQFEIRSPTADLTLVARKGLPLPGLTNYAYLSTNPGPNDELITLFDFSSPVPLTPGNWFIAALNVLGEPANYTIVATEFPAYGTNIVITDSQVLTNSFCLTWVSMPGIHYFVQGKSEVNHTNWTTVSPTIIAADALTTCCIPLPSSNHFFRVCEGLVVAPYTPPVQITGITRDTNGVLLQWLAPSNSQFQVQWTLSLAPPAWTSFTNILISTNGDFSFLDDGSQSGGLGGPRYYRLRQLP